MAQYYFHTICLHSPLGRTKTGSLLQLKPWASVQALHSQVAISLRHVLSRTKLHHSDQQRHFWNRLSLVQEDYQEIIQSDLNHLLIELMFFFSISQKTRYQSRHMIASRLQDGKKHFRLPWYFFLHHEIWLLSLGFLPLLVLAFALYIVFYQKQILVAISNYFPDVFFLNFFTCAFRIYNKGLSSDPH